MSEQSMEQRLASLEKELYEIRHPEESAAIQECSHARNSTNSIEWPWVIGVSVVFCIPVWIAFWYNPL
jgi:hypothetical protein